MEMNGPGNWKVKRCPMNSTVNWESQKVSGIQSINTSGGSATPMAKTMESLLLRITRKGVRAAESCRDRGRETPRRAKQQSSGIRIKAALCVAKPVTLGALFGLSTAIRTDLHISCLEILPSPGFHNRSHSEFSSASLALAQQAWFHSLSHYLPSLCRWSRKGR